MSERKESEKGRSRYVEERPLRMVSGYPMLALMIILFLVDLLLWFGGIYCAVTELTSPVGYVLMIIAAVVLLVVWCVLLSGFHVVNPNEALVMTLFGNYYGTVKKAGFYYTNPFAVAANPVKSKTSKKISLKTMTLNNEKQKVNDVLGNPLIIGAVVIWRVTDPTKAVFNVENYRNYLSIQCDSTIRNIARLYPYDTMEDESDGDGRDEKTLRGSSQEIADNMKAELSKRVEEAGLEVMEVRITHLSYAEEIAAAMLQRQQAVAVIAARRKIVEGAVSMVQMAIDQLSEEEIVVLDEERKAAMVSNLLVVLCGNKDAQPIVNSGSIY